MLILKCVFTCICLLFFDVFLLSLSIQPGTPPSTEVPYSSYPIVIHPDHDKSASVLVVQDFTFGKYLGRLDVEFDNEGRVTSYAGNPILLDNTVEQGML